MSDRGGDEFCAAVSVAVVGIGHYFINMQTPDAVSVPAVVAPMVLEAEIARLAQKYHRAQGGVMALVTGLGTKIERQMESLPEPVQSRIEHITRFALERSYGLAGAARGTPDIGARGHVALASLTGAIGGFGGLPTALAELPVTVTLILRAIQSVAHAHGFDPQAEPTRRETLRVFGSGGPLTMDDGVNTAFIGARLTLTGPALHRMVAAVAPRVAAALGQKLAAQTVPVLGAVAGAGLNAAYMHYYREMAEVRFGLLTLAAAHDPAVVLAAFRVAAEQVPARR